MIKVAVRNRTPEVNTYRAARVKSLFNASSGSEFNLDAELPIDEDDWQIGLIVGPSGSGKTSIGRQLFDRGDIAYQDWCFIDPALYAMKPNEAAQKLWREHLQPMGIKLMSKALDDIAKGIIIRNPQDQRFSTWEPSTEVKDIYRPDLLTLPPATV